MVTLTVGSKLVNNMVAYEDGKQMINDENPAVDTKMPKMKELCSILAQ